MLIGGIVMNTIWIFLSFVGGNCELIYLLSCGEIYGKEFEGFEIFLFQDANVFIFQGPP
jgi:hypothetical protein